ncbi:hypothetical protein GCM10009714_17780 [Microlunatus capsulatus]
MDQTVNQQDLAGLIAAEQLEDAVEASLERPTRRVVEQLAGANAPAALPQFLDRWLGALPPLERLAAAASLASREQLLESHTAAVPAFVAELRGFWSFTDSPDSEVSPAIMDRLHGYAAQVESMSFDPAVERRDPPRSPVSDPAGSWPSDDDLPFEPLPTLPVEQNELMSLIASGQLDEAVRLALGHRDVWIQTRLDYVAVEDNDEASSAFLQAWLPALPGLERLQAAGWASSHFQLALVHLPHAYGIGAQLVLDALAAGTARWAELLRDLGASEAASEQPDTGFSRRLVGYAAELDAMSFEPIPAEPWT